MKEDFLHFIFKNRLWKKTTLFVDSDQRIEIIDTGFHNTHSGPDFFNAKVKIGKTIWVGNVEIHINSSDWHKHNHGRDKTYDSVILHVVFNNDEKIKRSNGETIPTWEIQFPHYLYNKYTTLKNNSNGIPCKEYLDLVKEEEMNRILQEIAIEKMSKKSEEIERYLKANNNNWDATFLIILSKSFGFSVNSLPFEMLASSIDINIIRKLSDDVFALETLLLGQSGLLDSSNYHDYYTSEAMKMYKFLSKKHCLKPMSKEIWKTGKVRPTNSPYLRIAQLAATLNNFQGLLAETIKENKLDKIRKILSVPVSEDWKRHYMSKKSIKRDKLNIGTYSINSIIINAIIPFRFLYDNHYSKSQQGFSKTINSLKEIKAESNSIVSQWKSCGVKINSALETQSLLYLKSDYCNPRRCLFCKIGHSIFTNFSKI